jgi:hypothetical protein
MTRKKLTKRKTKYFIREEIKAAKEYHPYIADREIKEIEHDEKHHRKVFTRKLKKMRKVS